MRRKAWALAVATALVTTLFATAAVAANPETADVFGQGPGGPVVAEDGAKIRRTAKGVTASVTMPTPEPGSYNVPPAGPTSTSSGVHGSPAAFSLWVFIFFNPEACVGPCDGTDLMRDNTVGNRVIAGGYNAGGHLASGPHLTISGRVNEASRTFGGPNAESIAQGLGMGHDIATAEIHLAVAPHGRLNPALLPGQISTPAGTSLDWWLATMFD
jgi:hypothetical protein